MRSSERSGTWTACLGQVIPAGEDCADGVDNDCNGMTDEELDAMATASHRREDHARRRRRHARQGGLTPGEVITLRIAVWDTSDHQLDSLAVIDGFKWSTEVAQPGTVIF
jgi:hypothetical protein